MSEEQVRELIRRRRLQMLVSSYLYYHMDYNMIDDYEWTMRAQELKRLQEEYPEISSQVEYAEEFKNWNGCSGYGLPMDEKTINRAHHLMRALQRRGM